MRRLACFAAVAAGFLLAACDEEKKTAVSEPAPELVPEVRKPRAARVSVDSEAPPAEAAAEAASLKPESSDADPGRVTFDGDRTRAGAISPPGAVFTGNGGASPRLKFSYDAPASANTLAIKEPPAPGSKRNSLSQGSRQFATETNTNAKEEGLRDAVADQTSVKDAAKKACPDGMSRVEGFCIDKFEGSLTKDGKAASIAGVKPKAYISGDQAAAACSASGKRLCTMKEWVTACQGSLKTQYPYGATYEPGACNEYDHKDHAGHRSAMHRLFGDNASFSYGPMNDPRIDEMPETVAPSGSFARCTNSYGVYDMVGNLHEWVSDRAGGRGVFKGGYFEDTHLNGEGCRYTTTAHEPSYHDYSTGFRCCAD